MSREDNYRSGAAASLHRALRATSIADKARLLAMAEAWLDLADRARKVTEQRVPGIAEHVLVRARLGG
jgi:hypothetical protein